MFKGLWWSRSRFGGSIVLPAIVAILGLLLGVPLIASAENAVQVPDVTAHSVFAFDSATGEVILEQNPDQPLAIGSVTKVATALVVIEHADLDEEVEILGIDMVPPGFSAMGLQPGDTLTVEQLLTGLLVASGGDAALALARHVGTELSGSDDPEEATAAFVEAMNAKASELGLANTQFSNPDGDDSDEAWSTARDVATMYAALVANSRLAEMAGLAEYAFASVGPEQTPYAGLSTNQLAGQHDVLSAKTGSTLDAGGCLVLARSHPESESTEIVAILGSTLEYDETWTATIDERWNDATAVIDVIDADWTPGQNLVARVATEAPKAAAPPVEESGAKAPNTDSPPPQALVLEEDSESSSVEGSKSAPLLAGTIAGGVLAFAGVFTWSRSSTSRP